MRGKRPKPTALKRLTGNPGKRPLNDDEPMPALVIPECPEWLNSLGRAEWDRIARELHAAGCIAEIYRTPLAAHCMLYARWLKAEGQVAATGGDVLTSTEGGLYFNPWRGVADKALSNLLATSEMFGMTPSSKSRIKAVKQDTKSALRLFASERGA